MTLSSPNYKAPPRIGELTDAVAYHDIEAVKDLLSRGANVNEERRVDGMTPLALAALRGQLDIMRLLLEKGALVDKGVSGGQTPLMFAILWAELPAMKLLLEKGASIDQKESLGYTALMYVASAEIRTGKASRMDLARLLVEKGASLEEQNIWGSTAQALARNARHTDVAQFLEEAAVLRRKKAEEALQKAAANRRRALDAAVALNRNLPYKKSPFKNTPRGKR